MSDDQTVGTEAEPAESAESIRESARSAESTAGSAESTGESAESTAGSAESTGESVESAESTAESAPTGRGSGEGARQVLSDRTRRDAVKLVRSANRDAEARRRRMQSLAGGLAGLAAVVLVVVGYVVLNGSAKTDGSTGAGGQAAATAGTDQGAAGAPSLPPGADPALGQEPAVSAGSGDLTKLVVKTLIQGTGPAVKAGQNITVNYIGITYKDGQKFDASWDRGQPASFPIGVGQVIPGWDQGLVGVKVGSRVQLDIPANLAYGDNPANGAPGGPLRFVVDLLAAQ